MGWIETSDALVVEIFYSKIEIVKREFRFNSKLWELSLKEKVEKKYQRWKNVGKIFTKSALVNIIFFLNFCYECYVCILDKKSVFVYIIYRTFYE